MMSAIGGLGIGGAEAPKKHGRGRPLGSSKKAKAEAVVTPPVTHRHGRPPGSKNKKLAAATTTATAPSAAAAAIVGPSRLPPVL
jgi:hypothetical protein